jgi:hypothetical protein
MDQPSGKQGPGISRIKPGAPEQVKAESLEWDELIILS